MELIKRGEKAGLIRLDDERKYITCVAANKRQRYSDPEEQVRAGHADVPLRIRDAVRDPEGPFLCLPKIIDIRTDITTRALAEKGWTVSVNEQEENIKVQVLERKFFVPERNRTMCATFRREAQRDPGGKLGKSIIFAVNQLFRRRHGGVDFRARQAHGERLVLRHHRRRFHFRRQAHADARQERHARLAGEMGTPRRRREQLSRSGC